MSLTDNIPLLTALANDVGYEHVFSGQLSTDPTRRRPDRLLRERQLAERRGGDPLRAQPVGDGDRAARL